MFVNFIFIFVLQVVVRCSEIDIFPRMPITVEKSENVVCSEESKQYLDNLNNFTLWAHESKSDQLNFSFKRNLYIFLHTLYIKHKCYNIFNVHQR